MAKKNIISIGMQLPGCEVQRLDSKISLLDYDIIILNPSIDDFLGDYEESSYQGKPWLSDDMSFKLKEQIDHWRENSQKR
jgi:hypothetical protein